MADPRLQWRQISQPDFSTASEAMARAGTSFQRGVESANDILGRYEAGIQTKADAEAAHRLAGIDTQEELDAFLKGGGLSDLNVSEKMLGSLMGAQGQILGYGKDRASIRNTDSIIGTRAGNLSIAQDANSRAGALHGVAMADHEFRQGRRGELADASGAYVGALTEGREGGTYGPATGATDNTRLMLARTLQAEAGNQGVAGMIDVGSVIRNRAATGKYGEGIEGVIMRPGQFSAWNSQTGYAGGEQGQNMNFQPNADALAAADAILSGQYKDRTGGSTHYFANIPGVSGVPSWANDSFRQIAGGDHFFGNADGEGAIKGNTGAVPRSGTPARDELYATLADSKYLSPSDIDKFFTETDKAIARGDERIDTETDAKLAELNAQMILNAVQDPDILNSEQGIKKVLSDAEATGEHTPQEMIELALQAQAAMDTPALATQLSPTVEGDPELAATVENSVAAAETALRSTDQARAIGDIDTFREDPSGALIDALDLGGDGQNPGAVLGIWGERGFDPNGLKNLLNDYVREFGEEPAKVAVAMRDAFNRDPSILDGEGGFMSFRNTLENRFDRNRVAEELEKLSQGDVRDYRERRSNTELMAIEMRNIQTQSRNLRTQMAKLPEGSPQWQALSVQVDALAQQIADIEANRR